MPQQKGSFWSSGKWTGISALATVIAALFAVLAVVGLPWGAESSLPDNVRQESTTIQPPAVPAPLAPPAILAAPAAPAIPAPLAPPAIPGVAVGSISGYVYDAQGQPIVGASVDALVYTGGDKAGEKKWHALTDGGGHYQIKNIPAGNYRVIAWAPKHVRKHWKNTLLRNNATPVSVTAPNDTANIIFKLEPGGTISGTVKDITTGKPLVNVSVTGERVDGEGRGRTTTDQNGNYTIYGLPFGKYKVNSPIGDGWGSGDDGYITEYSAYPVTIAVQNPDAAGIHFGLGN